MFNPQLSPMKWEMISSFTIMMLMWMTMKLSMGKKGTKMNKMTTSKLTKWAW